MIEEKALNEEEAAAPDYFQMAEEGTLPEGFDRWELRDKEGNTVAHVAAEHGHLPKDFNQWELADEDDWTVAHVAAWHGHLPEDFNQWDLADNYGRTVEEVYYGCND